MSKSSRYAKAFAFLAFAAASLTSGSAMAQSSCDAVGSVSHHFSLDHTNQVKGSGLRSANGIQGKSLQLAASSRAYIDALPIGASNALTVGMWVRPENANTKEARLLSQAQGTANNDHDLMVSVFNKTALRFRLRVGNKTHTLVSGNNVLTPLKWSHVAVTYNGAEMVIYRNGQLVARKPVTGNVTIRSTVTGIGNQPPGKGNRPYIGKIDEMVVFNRALNATQVRKLATRKGLACSGTYAQAGKSGNSTASAAPVATQAATPAPVPVAPKVVATPAATPTTVAAPRVSAAAQPQAAAAPNATASKTNLPVYKGNSWPSSNDKLPMGGVFYGTSKAGMMSGNGPISQQNAIRFRAQRSGPIKAVRYNNRILRQTDIDDRCAIYGKGSVWCNCKEAGLDNLSCGYTLPNSYHVGNGGLITIEIRNNDNSAQNLPGSSVLATSKAYIPTSLNRKFPVINLQKQVNLKAGEIYHIVFRNDRPPTNCNFRNVPIAQARNCQRNRGAIGINGTQHATDPTSLRPFGPFLGAEGTGLHARASKTARWKSREDVVPFYEVQYTDGTFVGETYAGFDNTNYGKPKGTRDIEGAKIGRQVFTVLDANRNVNGLWINYGHSFLKTASGAAMNVTLKASNGSTLATGSISSNKACSTLATGAVSNGKKPRETREDWMCRTWGYTNLSKAVNLVKGRKYSVEFSAPQGAAFVLSSYFSYNGKEDVNNWKNAQAEFSANSGRNWNEWSGNGYFMTRDLPVVFTIVGMPKQLP